MLIPDAIHKADRLEQIKVLFRRRPEGVGTGEIARLLGVSQRTARRYGKELSERGRLPVYQERRVWRLVGGGHIDLLRLQLNLDEALSLYLAARMRSAYSDKHNPHVVAATASIGTAGTIRVAPWPAASTRTGSKQVRTSRPRTLTLLR